LVLLAAGDLAAWQRIAWWEGPDAAGHLRLTVSLDNLTSGAQLKLLLLLLLLA
jgi:hypothetical protein